MKLKISAQRGSKISEGMFGLFFEDINYGADGGLYAEMIENRSFEFYDSYGDKGNYYAKKDCGYGWNPTTEYGCPDMKYVEGSPLDRNNPHYLRFTSTQAGQGFTNKAYSGIFLEKDKEYKVSFYARATAYQGDFQVYIKNGERIAANSKILRVQEEEEAWHKWNRYEAILKASEDVDAGSFVIALDKEGVVEFDFISMMPMDAVAGVFRKDLFDILKELHPGFLRFPGGCVVEGNTLENRYRWKESIGRVESRKCNYNRWSLHGTNKENGWHAKYSYYNQSLGIGFYEYFLLSEMIGAKPLPVLNVGIACQYQSYELVEINSPEFQEYVQDALDLIEFANGSVDTYWGGIRAKMGHPEAFGLSMIGIGNEQWQTETVDFYERYQIFEKAIHEKYPGIRIIGSAGPDITSEHYQDAWNFYHKEVAKNSVFSYAVDEHYYVKPEWFYEHVDFYDDYPRDVKVFAGEYAAHPKTGANMPSANTLEGALSEAAFLTGVEKNADIVVLASYAPLFARLGYAQWSPDMIWFDERKCYPTASYYVQKMYGENLGTTTVPMNEQEKEFRKQGLYVNVTYDENKKEYIIKAVNSQDAECEIEVVDNADSPICSNIVVKELTALEDDSYNKDDYPQKVNYIERDSIISGSLTFQPKSFTVVRIML